MFVKHTYSGYLKLCLLLFVFAAAQAMPLCIKSAAASESIDQPTEEDANFGEVYDVRSVAREPDEETFLPVKDRQFPDLAPKGVIIGKLNVLPQLSFQTLYNDNLYATSENETSDIAEHVIPAITVKTLQDRHFFGLQANAEIIRQLEQTSENRENYYVNAGGYFEARHDLLLPYNLTYTVDHHHLRILYILHVYQYQLPFD